MSAAEPATAMPTMGPIPSPDLVVDLVELDVVPVAEGLGTVVVLVIVGLAEKTTTVLPTLFVVVKMIPLAEVVTTDASVVAAVLAAAVTLATGVTPVLAWITKSAVEVTTSGAVGVCNPAA